MINVLYTRLKEIVSDGEISPAFNSLPLTLQQDILRYHRLSDRHAHLGGKILLREGLRERGWTDSTLENIKPDQYGRLSLGAELDFNISHSGQYVVCALTKLGRVGIDIEKCEPIDLNDFLSQLSHSEQQDIFSAPNPHHRFYEYWTIKESVVKADGRGLNLSLTEIETDGERAKLEGKVWFIHKLALDPEYCCALATDIEAARIKIREFNAW